jgi:hypothetical protein
MVRLYKNLLHGMHPIVCQDNKNGADYLTIISVNVNKDKFILIYHHSFIVQSCSATCFDLQEVIIRCTYKNSVLVLELYFNMDPYNTNCFILIVNTTVLLNTSDKYTKNTLII